MQIESVAFAEKYAAFRQTVEDKILQLEKRRFAPPDFNARPDVVAWKNIADEVDRTAYTAFVGKNDPASAGTVGCKPEEWFDRAIKDIGKMTYHRYSPFQGRDEYPVEPIHLGFLSRSVQFWSVSMVKNIVNTWLENAVCIGEELQAPGKSGPQ